jgi:hypothetical protein
MLAEAVELCLLSFKDVLKGSSVTCYTDSQNVASIILKGSSVTCYTDSQNAASIIKHDQMQIFNKKKPLRLHH